MRVVFAGMSHIMMLCYVHIPAVRVAGVVNCGGLAKLAGFGSSLVKVVMF